MGHEGNRTRTSSAVVLLAFFSLVLCGWGSLPGLHKKKPEPKTHFYFGMDEKPVYSRSVVDSPKSRYVFEPALQFDLVMHDFVVKNTTGRTLELNRVSACCGAFVEHHSTQIPPGLEGVIRLVLLTDRKGGQDIAGEVQAQTNDPVHPVWTIEIHCHVRKFADISDYIITLVGPAGAPIEGSTTIVPTEEYPFTITGLKAKKGRDIDFWYRRTTEHGKKAYVLTVRNKRKEAGVFRDTIFVQTDNKARPEFKIRVQGKVGGS
ncbi:MAG TPA: hypothetical protein PLS81_00200 [Deltaproteobacteria bacterium]|nr:hypothetical protein [Deltaproteobacteria bacterium]HOM27863.1 hypothetical protein [Deltaproteobacteria bacterium]